jgi:hypothetical protein
MSLLHVVPIFIDLARRAEDQGTPKTFSALTVENRTFSGVPMEYSGVFKAPFEAFELDSIPEFRWKGEIRASLV